MPFPRFMFALCIGVGKMDKVKLGIIGIGGMGGVHCGWVMDGLLPEIELVAVADVREARRDWARENLPETVQIFEDGDMLIDAKCCDAVVVATPHYAHPYFSKRALENGIHVISEKPAGVYTKQVRETNEAAAKSDAVYAVMFNQRTNHLYRKMKEIVDGGEYGQIKRVSWLITDWYRTQKYYDNGDWRGTWDGEGGGVLMNQCPHQLDLLQWICGMPVKIQAFCHEGKWHHIEVEDDVTAYLEFANGATGVFITTTGDYPGTNRFEITLERAKLVCEDGKLSFYVLDQSEREVCFEATVGVANIEGHYEEVETDGENPQHVGVMKAFAAHILRGEPLVARGEEGINSLMVANAMYLSSWLGKPVTIPVDEEIYLKMLNEKRATSKKKEHVEEAAINFTGTFGSGAK